MNLTLIVHTVLDDYALPWHGTHGIGHSGGKCYRRLQPMRGHGVRDVYCNIPVGVSCVRRQRPSVRR